MFENFEIRLHQISFNVWVILGIMLLIPLFLFFLRRKRATQAGTLLNTKVLVYGSLCVALSFVLSYIRLFSDASGRKCHISWNAPSYYFCSGLRSDCRDFSRNFLRVFELNSRSLYDSLAPGLTGLSSSLWGCRSRRAFQKASLDQCIGRWNRKTDYELSIRCRFFSENSLLKV